MKTLPSPAHRLAALTAACCLPLLAGGAGTKTVGQTTLSVGSPAQKLKVDRDVMVRGDVEYPMGMTTGSAHIFTEFDYGYYGSPHHEEQDHYHPNNGGNPGDIVTANFEHTYDKPRNNFPPGVNGAVGAWYNGNDGGSLVWVTVGFSWDVNP